MNAHLPSPNGSSADELAPVEDAWEMATQPVDWDELEAEAERQGCTVADVVYDRAGRHPDPV